MFALIEVEGNPRLNNAITDIQAYGPFASRKEAVDFFLGERTSVLREKLEADNELKVNNTTIKVVELSHPTQ